MDPIALKEKIKQEEAALQNLINDANQQISYLRGKIDSLKQLLEEIQPSEISKPASTAATS